MVDALVSGASAERRVGSSPILGTSDCLFGNRFLLCQNRTRSACGASGDLSASCVGGASLCDDDAKSRYCQVNKFPRQHQLFTSGLWPCTTAPPLGHLSAAAAVRVQVGKLRYHIIFWAQAIVFLAIAFFCARIGLGQSVAFRATNLRVAVVCCRKSLSSSDDCL